MISVKKALANLNTKNLPQAIFSIDSRLNENLRQFIAQHKSPTYLFGFRLGEDEHRKAFKIIGTLIEDEWATENALQGEDWIILQVHKRKKQQFVFPQDDSHFSRFKDRYQYSTLLAALPYVKQKRIALDVGGHIGFYSSALLDTFERVIAFEPSPTNIKCFAQNCPEAKLYTCGLGDHEGVVDLNIAHDNSGNNSIVEAFGSDKVRIDLKTLDSFGFTEIDLIKIDVQGYEEKMLIGAKETILKNKPILIVEVVVHKNSPPNQRVLDLLQSYGYETVNTMGKDFIMRAKE